ncbi:hypothetical protein G6F70_008829 [Rhizopus microsporus]|nr:hypothetical protein G6F71_009230 [Rhizopus microsporus]KAG1194496.1 hypothetical protein G6F70_008829 [Rhizopus microsporus]KAG1205864.1 hypothetical protein G6F69_009221 [Rhizopus microsporus]KAG1225879.1 hypothetical protein G6F67_009181 [Rhizopus microsporus]KAG1257202.1 hypothetical protein G6F68_009423 [Rhizopus microsporus]
MSSVSTVGSTMESNSRSAGGHLVRFLNDIKDFSGSVNPRVENNQRLENPLVWLKRLDRLKELAHLSDKEILLIAADHLVSKAEIWYDIACKGITTWSEFTKLFKSKYCAGMEDLWWSQIRTMKQAPGESVEDIDLKLRELFTLVGVVDESIMVRAFLDAIVPQIAWEVEKNNSSTSRAKLDDVVKSAARFEAVMLKYRAKGFDVKGGVNKSWDLDLDSVYSGRNDGSKSAPDAHSINSSSMDDLLREFRELKISLVQSVPPSVPSGDNRDRRGFNCFYWTPTMKVLDVPEPVENPSKQINFIDSIPAVAVYAADHTTPVEAKTTKRRRVQSTPLDGALVATNPTPVGGDGAGNIDVDIIMGETTRTSKPRKRVVRRAPKRIPVTIQKHNIWNKLAKVDAGLSVSDWLYLDRQAIKDLVDGCRTLRSRRKKVAVKGENIVITAADPRPREPKLRVVPPIVPPGMTHSNMATAGFGPPQVVGAVDLQDDDGSEWSDVASVSDGSANTWTMDSDDSLSVSSDEESVTLWRIGDMIFYFSQSYP